MMKTTKSLRTLIAALSVTGFIVHTGGRAEAQMAPRPAAVKEVRSQLGASINNAGLQQSFDFTWRRATSASKSAVMSEAHIAFGGTLAATPASVRGGAWVEIAPVSFFVIRAGADPSHYFGTFHSLASFDSKLDVFDSDARKTRAGAASGRTTRFYVTPTVQVRAGRFAAQSSLDIERWSSTAAGPMFYEPTRDTLLDVTGDRLTTLSSVVLYEHTRTGGGKFSIGPMHSLTRIHSSSLNQIQKVGLVIIQQASGRHLGLSRPRVSLLVGRYVDDPSKSGQWSAAVAVGFTLKRR